MVTSLVAVVVSRASKIIKTLKLFLKEEKICYKMVYYTFRVVKTFLKGTWHLKGYNMYNRYATSFSL